MNAELVIGLLGLVPVHVSWPHISYFSICANCKHISQGNVTTPLRYCDILVIA